MIPKAREQRHYRFAALSPQRQRNAIEYLIFCEVRNQPPNRSTFKEVTGIRHSQVLYHLVKLLTDAGVIASQNSTWERMVCTRRGRGARLPVMPAGNMQGETTVDARGRVQEIGYNITNKSPNTPLDLHINERPHTRWTPPTMHRDTGAGVQS